MALCYKNFLGLLRSHCLPPSMQTGPETGLDPVPPLPGHEGRALVELSQVIACKRKRDIMIRLHSDFSNDLQFTNLNRMR